MAVGKGGSQNDQSQNQSYNGATAGTTDTSTAGTSTANSSGTSTGTTSGSASGTTTANPTAGYGSVSDILQGVLGGGNGGLTPEQQAQISGILGSSGTATNNIDYGNSVLSQYVGDNHPAYQAGPTTSVGAPSASSLISNYLTPFQQDVTNTTGADMEQAFKGGLNDINAEYGGQMGNGRAGVATGQALGDYTRALGTTLANTNEAGFNTALSGAQGETANDLSANTTNAQLQQQNNQFNVGAQQANDASSIGVLQNYLNNTIPTENNVQVGDANAISGMSGNGISQMLAYLQSQVPAFGQSNTGNTTGTQTGSTAGTQTGSTTGTSNTNATGTASGNSSGVGSSTGKNGGISF